MANDPEQAAASEPRYRGFLACFNRREYYEAHEVLETLWLRERGPRRDFYQGLIQLAAAFLKLEQDKPAPAGRLAQRALARLEPYRPRYQGLDVDEICGWLRAIQQGKPAWPRAAAPQLLLGSP